MDFTGNKGTPKSQPGKDQPTWESEPSGISAWLNKEPHHNVIFGRALLDVYERGGGQMYWVVLPKTDAERIHRQVYGNNPAENLDPEHKFGLEGLRHTKRGQNDYGRWVDMEVPVAERRAVPPAKRYLGHWSDDHARRAIALAQKGAGPQMPEDWPEEDVQLVAQSHAGILAREKAIAEAKERTVISPRSKPAVELPPEQPKKKNEPVNRMRMRSF